MTTEEADYETHIGPSVAFDYEGTGVFDPEPEPDYDRDVMQALLGVIFELGAWAGKDRVRQYAAHVVMQKQTQCVRLFAKEAGVTESLVHLRIREGKRLVGLSPHKPAWIKGETGF